MFLQLYCNRNHSVYVHLFLAYTMSKINQHQVSQGASIKTNEYKSMLLYFIEQIALQKQYHCLNVQNTLLMTFKGETLFKNLPVKQLSYIWPGIS